MAHKKRWWTAGLLGFLAALCRPVGVALLLPLLLMYLKETGLSLKNLKVNALALLLIPLGLAAFAGYCYTRLGEPLASYTRASLWRQGVGGPWAAFRLFFDLGPALRGFYNSWIDFAVAILALAGLPLLFRRLGAAYGPYASAMILIPLCSGLAGFQRLVLASFPHFLILGTLGRTLMATRTITVFCIAGMALYFAIFSQWGWIA